MAIVRMAVGARRADLTVDPLPDPGDASGSGRRRDALHAAATGRTDSGDPLLRQPRADPVRGAGAADRRHVAQSSPAA